MRFRQLLQKYAWPEIEPVLTLLYPDQAPNIVGFRKAFDELRHLEPAASDSRIVLEPQWDDIEQKHYINVVSETPSGERFALDYVLWSDWLNMQIDEEILAHYGETAVISHCLYELTFYGYSDEEVQESRTEFLQHAEEANGRYGKTPPCGIGWPR